MEQTVFVSCFFSFVLSRPLCMGVSVDKHVLWEW